MKKTRISVTMTKSYIEKLARLVEEEGLYLTRGEIIREGLRHVFRGYGLIPSAKEEKALGTVETKDEAEA